WVRREKGRTRSIEWSRRAALRVYWVLNASMPLISPDVVGNALRAQDAGEVERRHAEDQSGGTQGRAPINRHGGTLEVVVPGDVAGVVHEERAELSARQRDRPRLRGARARRRARDIPGRVVVEDVVVEDVVAAERVALGNPVAAAVHDDVVVHGRVIVRRERRISRDLNAVPPAVRHRVVGDDLVGGAVVALNARGGPAGDDVVLDDRIGAGHVDAVDEVDLTPQADVVHHIADDLNARDRVVAAGPYDASIAARAARQVMHAIADHLAVIAVRRNALGTAPGDIEVDDLDVIAVIRNGGAVRPIDLRAPFRIGDVGEECGGRPALGHVVGGVAPGVVAGGKVGGVARAHELGDALHRVAGGRRAARARVRARGRAIVLVGGAGAGGGGRSDRHGVTLPSARRRDGGGTRRHAPN